MGVRRGLEELGVRGLGWSRNAPAQFFLTGRGKKYSVFDRAGSCEAQDPILIVPVSDRAHELAGGFIIYYIRTLETLRSNLLLGEDAGTIIIN